MSSFKNSFLYPQKSLRAMLVLWFLLFSLIPLTFITGYSLVQFDKVFNDETLKRLNDNFIVISKSLDEMKSYLKTSSELHSSDQSFIFNISTKNIPNIKRQVSEWLNSGYIDQVATFDSEGQLLVSFMKDEDGFIVNDVQMEKGDTFLNEARLREINKDGITVLSDINKKSGFDLISYSKIVGKKNKVEGYFQEIIKIDNKFIENLKSRFQLDITILDYEFKVIASTIPEFLTLGPSYYKQGNLSHIQFFSIKTADDVYSVLIKPFERGQRNIRIALATSKKEIEVASKKINATVFKVVGLVILLIIVALWLVSKLMFKPLSQLMGAVKKLESGETDALVSSRSTSEIGELTKSFNEMSKKVTQAQKDLKLKVSELETANRDLQEAQAQLVHTAKMGSLGQVVAGVAHELNNPIGFIYSNMDSLGVYIEQLLELIEVAEKEPKELTKKKGEIDLDYIVQDLPKLLKSSKEGAKRVRDIVLNLKNFSRTDELEKKEYNLEDGIESTLEILKSELKDRIKIHKDYGKIPPIYCYAGQMNQVFMNILSNASQAIKGKGDIWITTRKKGLEIVITIKDNGSGISKKNQEKIFDPFFTTKPVGQGTGLGLSISYGIVEKHHGRILLKSEEGEGTEFEIYLPLITPQEKE